MSADELNRMVQVFRVHELQLLLGSANKNRFGKKQELLDRVKEILLKGPSVGFQNRIRELYQKRFPPQDTAMSSRQHYSMRSSAHSEGSYRGQGAAINGIQRPPSYPYPNQIVTGVNPLNFSMPYNSSSRSVPRANLAENVKAINLPFYDYMATLLPLQLLVPRQGEKQQEACFTFQVDEKNDRHIAVNYDRQRTPLPRVEFQLRFFVADTHEEQKDDFPLHAEVRVNDLQVELPPVIPTNKQGVEPKRPSRPVDITPYYCARRHRVIRLNIRWQQSQERKDKLWVCGVFVVRKVTSDILLQRLIVKGSSMPQETKTLIRKKLSLDTDSDICTESYRISLLCPLVKTRMRVPGKVRSCSHIQCFDLDSFLRMNEKRPTWICPVCNRPAHFDDLIIEGYFEEVLKWVECNEGSSRIVEIEVFKNGVWNQITEEQKDKEEADKTAARDKVCAYRGDNRENKGTPPQGAVKPGDSGDEKKSEADVIDLTSDDEESRPGASSSVASNTERASSVSSGGHTPANMNRNSNRGVEGAYSSSSSSSSSESRASPSVIVLDSPPSNRTSTPEEGVRNRRRSPCGRSGLAPPKKRFLEDRRGRNCVTSEGSRSAAANSVICSAPPSSVAESASGDPEPALPSLSDVPSSSRYPPTVPRIMGGPTCSLYSSISRSTAIGEPSYTPASTAFGTDTFGVPSYYGSLQSSAFYNPPTMQTNVYGSFPSLLSSYQQQGPGNPFFNFASVSEDMLPYLEQSVNDNFQSFLNDCMNDTARLLHNTRPQ